MEDDPSSSPSTAQSSVLPLDRDGDPSSSSVIFRGRVLPRHSKRKHTRNDNNNNNNKLMKQDRLKDWRNQVTATRPPTSTPILEPTTPSPTHEPTAIQPEAVEFVLRASRFDASRAVVSTDGNVLAVVVQETDSTWVQTYDYDSTANVWVERGDLVSLDGDSILDLHLNSNGEVLVLVAPFQITRVYRWNGMAWRPFGQDLLDDVPVGCNLDRNVATLSQSGLRLLLVVSCKQQMYDYDPNSEEWVQVGQTFPFLSSNLKNVLSADGQRLLAADLSDTSPPHTRRLMLYQWNPTSAFWEPLLTQGFPQCIVALSPGGTRVACSTDMTGRIRVFQVAGDALIPFGNDIVVQNQPPNVLFNCSGVLVKYKPIILMMAIGCYLEGVYPPEIAVWVDHTSSLDTFVAFSGMRAPDKFEVYDIDLIRG
eukprot:scaffold11_cov142-Amphora_coffeaeformis.AAC.2